MGRWGDGEMGRWGDGEMGRWGDGEMGRWGDGERHTRRATSTTLVLFTPTLCLLCLSSTLFFHGYLCRIKEEKREEEINKNKWRHNNDGWVDGWMGGWVMGGWCGWVAGWVGG